jgi:hypothetical protein
VLIALVDQLIAAAGRDGAPGRPGRLP